jgi:hypothetical protein
MTDKNWTAWRIKLDELAEEGPITNHPCMMCESDTRSHFVHNGFGGNWTELSVGDRSAIESGNLMEVCAMCHECFLLMESMDRGEMRGWEPEYEDKIVMIVVV